MIVFKICFYFLVLNICAQCWQSSILLILPLYFISLKIQLSLSALLKYLKVQIHSYLFFVVLIYICCCCCSLSVYWLWSCASIWPNLICGNFIDLDFGQLFSGDLCVLVSEQGYYCNKYFLDLMTINHVGWIKTLSFLKNIFRNELLDLGVIRIAIVIIYFHI